MTLKELKDKKIFSPNIKDVELIKICNEVLKPDKEIKTMDFELSDELLDKVRYSKQMIDFLINKIISNKDLSNFKKYNNCINYLNSVVKSISKKSSMREEVKYINQVLNRLNAEKKYYETIDLMAAKNKDTLMGVDSNNLTKLNKEALAVMMSSMMGNQDNMVSMMNVLLEEIKKLNAKVDELSAAKTVAPLGELEMPPRPEFMVEEEEVAENLDNRNMPPLIPENSLHDLMNRNVLPKFEEQQLIDYCNNVLGMNVTDLNFVPSEKQLAIINGSALVSGARIRKDIQGQHVSVSNKYSQLISSYQAMLDDIKGKPGFESDVANLESLIEKITSKREEYLAVVESFDAENMEQYFQFGASRSEDKMKKKTSEQQKELSSIDESLIQLQERKNSLEKNNYKNVFRRMKNNRDLKKINSRIEKLQNKRGKINDKQREIVGKYTSKYVAKMEKEFASFVREQEKMNAGIQKKQDQILDLNERQKKLDKLSRKIVSIEEKKSRFTVVQSMKEKQVQKLESRKQKLQTRIANLQTKIGNVDLSKQYSTTFNNEFAYAL